MNTSSTLLDALQAIIQVAQQAQSELLKIKKDSENAVAEEAFDEFPHDLDAVRKQLANTAARITQLATDPKEYLEQLSANVCAILLLLSKSF